MTIKNAKDINLSQSPGTLPDVSGAMRNWFQKMTFIVITQTMVNHRVVDSLVSTNFEGVIQPLSDQMLSIKSIGERKWKWHVVHADTSLALTPGDKLTYLGEKYRVMSKGDYSKYGYVKYDLVEGFQS